MAASDTPNKLEQFDEFFSIAHEFAVNIVPIAADRLPSYEHFLNQIPLPFRIASDMVALDQAALRPIQGLSGVAGQLVEYLNHQAHKIDLLVGYILSQQDEPSKRYQGIKFGGGGLIFSADTAFDIGQMLEMKVFLLEDNCAVYCIGEVIEVEEVANDDGDIQHIDHKVIYHFLREEDREVLVRTSLHMQSKQLQALAKQRNQNNNNGES